MFAPPSASVSRTARIAVFDVAPGLAAGLAVVLPDHEVRIMPTGPGLLTLVREWHPDVIVLFRPGSELIRSVGAIAGAGQLVVTRDGGLALMGLAEVELHAWLPAEATLDQVQLAVESGLRREREQRELRRHQEVLRRILALATVVGRLRSPDELPLLALEGFVDVMAGPGGTGAFAMQLGAAAPVRYIGVGRLATMTGHLDLPDEAAAAIASCFRGEADVVRTSYGLVLSVRGSGECVGALFVDGVDLPASFDDLVSMFASLLGQSLSNAVLFQRSSHDALTGLYSRSFGLHRLTETLSLAERHPAATAVMVIDVDHFKRVNDTFGHAAGDTVLAALADLIRSSCRTSDVPARLGGEEFLVVLPRTDEAGAALVAERLRRVVAAWRGSFEGADLQMTISIGVAAAEPKELDGAQLVARADDALYVAKREGRNRVVRSG